MDEERYERIKELVNRGYKLNEKNAMRLFDEIERLRSERVEIIAAKEVVMNAPPLPESLVIDVLQKQVQSLQVQLATYLYK